MFLQARVRFVALTQELKELVELRRVTKRFAEFVAVDGVDLHIQPGEFLTLLGPSGCGKTTLLRIVSGFEQPTSGQVILEGRDVSGFPPYKRDVNQVFQSYALFPHLSVRENVAFGLKMKKVARAERQIRVAEAIELVALGGFENRKPSELSGGQKQRVALARALVCRPKVLLLDEPLAALDAKLRRAMQVELKRLQVRVGITFVFVTHDQEEALVMSDRIAVMNRGKVEQIGKAAGVYRRPATAFVADFLGQANVLPASLVSTDDGLCQIVVGGMRMSMASGSLSNESLAAVVVRPENISVSLQSVGRVNEFPGTIREEIYRGATRQLLVETPLGNLNVLRVEGMGGAEPGGHVFWHVNPSDIVPLPSTQ